MDDAKEHEASFLTFTESLGLTQNSFQNIFDFIASPNIKKN